MAGDHSRFTFDPRKGFSSVLEQQGRVRLDADANEAAALQDRRWRAETLDLVGRCVVPRTTEHGFEIVAGAGGLTIGPGRAYVDGIQVECWGAAPTQAAPATFDPALGELVGAEPLAFADQPAWHPALPGPQVAPGADDLVYLDVWQREVTALEDDDLLEPALGGPDTAARVQTVWQVKVLTGSGLTDCRGTSARWDALAAPSTACLTTGTKPVAATPGPCVIEPGGGYTGLENRLYRVEIQANGTIAAGAGPSFKWSRDNASVAVRVRALAAAPPVGGAARTTVTVDTTGRDDVTRLAVGNAVELLDDRVEYGMRESGQGGRLGRITAVDHANAQVTVDQDWTTFGVVAARHPRLRRWEGIDVPAVAGAAVELEQGATVTFTAGTVRAGDHWVFWARTANGKVEPLHDAPPRGILHHLCRLALPWHSPARDCRVIWPREAVGCCTVVVRPGESIQQAIDSLPAEGGCVCLKTGVHHITDPIRIERSRVLLHGESPGTVVEAPGTPASHVAGTVPVACLEIGAAQGELTDVVVEMIRFSVTSLPPAADRPGVIVSVRRGTGIRISDCEVKVAMGAPQTIPAWFARMFVGVMAADCHEVTIEACSVVSALLGIEVHGALAEHVVRGCDLRGGKLRISTLPASFEFSAGWIGVKVDAEGPVACRVEDNLIDDYWYPVQVGSAARGTRVAGNQIRRQLADRDATAPSDFTQYAEEAYWAIDTECTLAVVRENRIFLTTSSDGGIRARGRGSRVEENDVVADMAKGAPLLPVGVYCGPAPGMSEGPDEARIGGNRLTGGQHAILVVGCDGPVVARNQLDLVSQGLVGVRLSEVAGAEVAENGIREPLGVGVYASSGEHLALRANRLVGGAAGVVLTDETDPEVSGNGILGASAVGILSVFKGTAKVVENRLASCGSAGYLGMALGIIVADGSGSGLPGGSALFSANEVLDTGLAPDGTGAVQGPAVGISAALRSAEVVGNRVGYVSEPRALDPQQPHLALGLLGPPAQLTRSGAAPRETSTGSVLVTGNHLAGWFGKHVVELLGDWLPVSNTLSVASRFERVTFGNNVVEHLEPPRGREASVRLWGRCLAVTGNQVKGDPVPSVDLSNERLAAVIGNVTDGGFINDAGAAPAPVTTYNVQY